MADRGPQLAFRGIHARPLRAAQRHGLAGRQRLAVVVALGEHHAALLPDQSEVAGLGQGAQGGEGLLFLGLVVRLDALAVGLDVRGQQPFRDLGLQRPGQICHPLAQQAAPAGRQAQRDGMLRRLEVVEVAEVRGHRPAGGFPGHHLAQQRGAPAADFAEHEQVVVRLRHLQSEPRSLLGPRLPDPGQRFLQQLGRLGKPQRRGIDAQAQVGR